MEKWQDPDTLILWLALSLLLIMLLSTSIIWFTRLYFQRMMKSRALLAQAEVSHQKSLVSTSADILERERNRIAMELHDAISSKLNIMLIMNSCAPDQTALTNMLKECMTMTRQLSHSLSPPFIDSLSLIELLDHLILPLSKTFSVSKCIRRHHPEDITGEKKLHLYRIVQEVINNTIKHAQATTLCLHFRSTYSHIALMIKDDGIGYAPDTQKQGLGLQNIEIRTQIIGAIYRFRSGKKGTTFLLLLPLPLTETL